jgi:hypothetical protein
MKTTDEGKSLKAMREQIEKCTASTDCRRQRCRCCENGVWRKIAEVV